MENKDFWDGLSQGGTNPQAETGGTKTDITLDPGYRLQKKPTATDPPRERSLDIESVLADIRKKSEGGARTPVRVPSVRPVNESPVDETSADVPPSCDPPADKPDEKQLMQDVLTAVRELTDEVRQIRTQLETKPCDAVHSPSEGPPGSAADAEGDASETKPAVRSNRKKPVKNKVLSIVSSVLFYAVIVAMVLGAFLMRSTSKGEPFMIAGYSAANVLTSSMEDVYPKGSLIITKRVDAKELQIGDDITFMVSEDSSITHRIIEITEDYQGTGARAFKTQGTMNSKPDKEMVAAANVVGKVIFHSKALGDFANFVKANWPILIFALIVIIALITFLKWNAKRADNEERNPSADASSPKTGPRTKRRLRKSEGEVE